jgi:acetyl-CoA acetyltransferase
LEQQLAGNLSDKYCIAGIGETGYFRGSQMSTRQMAVIAVNAALADAGLNPQDLDGMMSYHQGDSVGSPAVAHDLGVRLNFHLDEFGGAGSTEALVGAATGVIEAGLCHTVAIFRSENGYTGERIGSTGVRAARPVSGSDLIGRAYGWTSPSSHYCFAFVRHMYEYGTTMEQAAQVRVIQSKAASNNPRAIFKQRVTVEDVLNSRSILRPLHLLDCCVETDNCTALIVTSVERARDLRQRPVHILGALGHVGKPHNDFWGLDSGPLTRYGGYYARDAIFAMAGVTHDDIDVTGVYDAFTYVPIMQLEEYGFCAKGEGGAYVTSGIMELNGRRPANTSGGQQCEGYTHGMNLVLENVRQLRWQADDSCSGWRDGVHTHDFAAGGCRQVREPQVSMNMGSIQASSSALILRRG